MNRRPNIVMIVVDALRADHVGCYGYNLSTSPHIDALCWEGALAEQCLCSGIPTHPSFTTLLTGQHPITHQIVAHGGKAQLAKDAPFLPKLLLGEGYTTCAVDNLLQTRQWFSRGFEFYIDPSQRRTLCIDVDCEHLNARAIPWLRHHADEQFFLFIHYWDPHWPLTPPQQYRNLFYQGNCCDPENHSLDPWWKHPLGQLARETWLRHPDGPVTDVGYVEALYNQEIRHVDDGIGSLISELDDLGLRENTIVLLLADHGESISEHGIFLEHHGLYEATLHVPLLVRWPGHIPAGIRLSALLQHQDIAPTLLEAIGLPKPMDMDGKSFWPLLSANKNYIGRTRAVSCECTWQAKWSLRTERYKFIVAREPDMYGTAMRELYDLTTDPREERNLAEDDSALARELEADLEGWISERLAALGRSVDPLRQEGVSLAALRSVG